MNQVCLVLVPPLLALTLVACESSGEGLVSAEFSLTECPPGTDNSELENYSWKADYLVTERYFETLIINIQEFSVDVFETDSLGIRLDLEGLEIDGKLVRDGQFFRPRSVPLRVSVGDERNESQVILSLYQTCVRLPGYSAIEGMVVFDEFRIRIDGKKTGDDERLVGRVIDAQLSYAQAPAPIGILQASFDFEPPERPLREFR
ncbi:MAG: hypothetical protein KTR25_12485 [Myxococcales bacterium]|nr:hypothetical protein [Myxococcales bacterium]